MAPKRRAENVEAGTEQTPRKVRRTTSDQDVPLRPSETPSGRKSALKATPSKNNGLSPREPTPKSVKRVLFSTPKQPPAADQDPVQTPKEARNDRSARRKSFKYLQTQSAAGEDNDVEDDVQETELARSILAEEDQVEQDDAEPDARVPDEPRPATTSEAPARRGRGRPKGKRREKSPSPPPAHMPSHELYFFQNKAGASKTSTNTMPSHLLLGHDDYREQIQAYRDPHAKDIERLKTYHARGFEQWTFELEEGFNLCFYGYGSKRKLIMDFMEHLFWQSQKAPEIVVVNGYASGLTIRDVLSAIGGQVLSKNVKLPAQPTAMLDLILEALTQHPRKTKLVLLIHSLDHSNLRKHQAMLARLASVPHIAFLGTCDTPNFPLLWDLTLTQQFKFLFHDCTTFEPYSAELDVVDDVNALLSRSGRRLGGKDGVAYVLKSLPENARHLFRILVSEQLAIADLTDDVVAGAVTQDSDDDVIGAEDADMASLMAETPSRRGRGRPPKKAATPVKAKQPRGEVGVEFRMLYHKAVEEFVCSSELNFRTLLKEFHDHQMIESRKDGMGTERLVVPFRREELEAVLEELV